MNTSWSCCSSVESSPRPCRSSQESCSEWKTDPCGGLEVRGVVFFRVVVRIVAAPILVLAAAKTPVPEDDREQQKDQRDRGEDQRERQEDAEDARRPRAHAEVDDRCILVPGRVVCGDANRVVAVRPATIQTRRHADRLRRSAVDAHLVSGDARREVRAGPRNRHVGGRLDATRRAAERRRRQIHVDRGGGLRFPLTGKTLAKERHAPLSTRYSEDWIPLVASVEVRVTSTEEMYDPSTACVPASATDELGAVESIFTVTDRRASLFPEESEE